MKLEEMERAVRDAEYTINRVDQLVGKMAYLIKGRLKKGNVDCYILADLKRELRDFNIHTYTWMR